MTTVTRIEWAYHTADGQLARPDTEVSVEIFRDGELLAQPRDTVDGGESLERAALATRCWTCPNGSANGNGHASHAPEFPEGIHGHLDVRFRVHGYDAFQIDRVESTVVSLEPRPTADGIQLVEARERFVFDGVGVLRAEPCEGTAILTFSY